MSILTRFMFLPLLLTLCFLCPLETPAAGDRQVGDFEVILYEQPHFVGKSMSWELKPGMRQRLVKNVSRDWTSRNANPRELVGSWGKGLVRSMKVGRQIGVFVFEKPDFCSTSTEFRSGRFTVGPGLHETLGIWEGKIRSMILHRGREPLGVLLMADLTELTVSKKSFLGFPIEERITLLPARVQFLPLSESETKSESIFRNLGGFMDDQTVSILTYGKGVKVALYRNSGLEGKSLVLPGDGSQETRFQLSMFNFQNHVSSARVFLDTSMSKQEKRSVPHASSSVRKAAPPASSAPSKVRVKAPPASRKAEPSGGGANPFCRQYAEKALKQIQQRKERTGAIPANDPVWKNDFDHHYNWCLKVPKTQSLAGTKMRDDWLSANSPSAKPKTPQGGGTWGISPVVSLESDTDRPGQDYKNFELDTPDPSLCQKACADDPDCQAYTYVKPGIQGAKARCWLKRGVPAAQSNNCCVSGVKGTTPIPP
jgi:hypothetical protein